ncbi:major facilitator superfamily MFS_1 [Pseudogulbenkiania ferrooxidans 2002]|uniref:Major facilitator superfamily MFS_1 n=2 Tax=Pseudogulbenkiania ferrooxidans TaxID=549169 RepID=B9YYH2_9NEIS|nr:major facilitator superfamily MFS_1 [Pseudogulbenkiania ferrooxidans 2002]
MGVRVFAMRPRPGGGFEFVFLMTTFPVQASAVGGWRTVLRSVAALLLGYTILMAGNGLFTTLTALRLIGSGLSTTLTGLIQSLYYVGFFAGTFACGGLIRQVGHHRAFAVMAATITCVALAQSLGVSPWLWALCRLLTGMALVGIFMVMESWLNGCAANHLRGQVMSVYMITGYLGISAGQWLLNVPLSASGSLFSVVGILFALSAIPVTLTTPGTHLGVSPNLLETILRLLATVRQMARLAPIGLGATLVAGCLSGAFYTMIPVFFARHGYGEADIAEFMGLSMLAALSLQWPVGRLSDKVDRRTLLARLCLAIGAIALAIALSGKTAWMLWLILAYVSVTFTLYGVASAIVNDVMPPESRIDTSSVLLLAFAAGGIAGPLLVSLFMDGLGPAGYFYCSAVLSFGLLAAMTRYRPSPRDA